jgi:hypothetical protein
MKVIIFTTCKPFEGDDAWRQEQAIKSWTLLEGMEKEIIVIGNDKGTKEICEKYNLIHEPNVRNLQRIPYLHAMLEIGASYAEKDDFLLWTNSDMIYFNDMIKNILAFKHIKEQYKIQNYALIGGRIDWHNPKLLDDLSKEHFISNMNINSKGTINICQTNSSKYECSHHALCGIDYVIHSPTTFINNINKNLVIAGTRHDMILVGTALQNKFFTCNITQTNLVIHQNHGYKYGGHCATTLVRDVLIPNNQRLPGIMKEISNAPIRTGLINNKITFIK